MPTSPSTRKQKTFLNISPGKIQRFNVTHPILRFKPVTLDLQTKLKAFIPEYIPTVGEVDAFLKIPKPSGAAETLGLVNLDEPMLNQSKKAKLDLIF